MSRQDPTYLYQFKNSSNYYFRINLIFFQKMGYDNASGHFVASLKTSNFHDAKLLALYIKRMIDKEFSMDTQVKTAYAMGDISEEEFGNCVAEQVETLGAIERQIALQSILKAMFVLTVVEH